MANIQNKIKNKLSVIIGRFQTGELHKGHYELFKKACEESENVLVMIGTTSATGTNRNPLNFTTVMAMVRSVRVYQPTGTINIEDVYELPDCNSNDEWSRLVDEKIAFHFSHFLSYGTKHYDSIHCRVRKYELSETDVTIWGGRANSISNSYNGKYPVKIIDEVGDCSATAMRNEIGKKVLDSFDFRSGIIYASQNRYPIVYSTVDVIIKVGEKYLVGKKGLKYCFVGGFVDSADNTVEESAIREMKEETGITQFDSISFLGSMKIDDPRYRGTNDSIMTHCFLVNEPKDLENEIKDMEFSELKLASIEELKECLHEYHKPLLTLIK